MNPITGECEIEIAGRKYTLRYDWSALAEVEAAHGDSPNFFNAQVIASIAAVGMKRNHPEMTPEKIMDLSPPLVPFINTVQAAMQYAYFGAGAVPDKKEDEVKKNTSPLTAGLWRRLKQRFNRA